MYCITKTYMVIYKVYNSNGFFYIIDMLIMSSGREMFETSVDLFIDYTYRTCICHVCYNRLIDIIAIMPSVVLLSTHQQCGICISTMHGHLVVNVGRVGMKQAHFIHMWSKITNMSLL